MRRDEPDTRLYEKWGFLKLKLSLKSELDAESKWEPEQDAEQDNLLELDGSSLSTASYAYVIGNTVSPHSLTISIPLLAVLQIYPIPRGP